MVGGWREGAREGGREGSRLAIDHSPETTILVSNFLLLSALICLLALPYRKGTMAWTRFSLSPALPPAFPLALAYLYKIVSTTTCAFKVPNMACPHHQGREM